jgi:hypothetical protein
MIYDVEDLFFEIEAIVKNNLNAKIVAVEAEKTAKGKGLALEQIASDAFYTQTWDDNIWNKSPAVMIALDTIRPISNDSLNAQIVPIVVEIILVKGINEAADGDTTRRILRYSRALKEIIEQNFDNNELRARIKVETIRPTSFRLEEDTSRELHFGGVELQIALA